MRIGYPKHRFSAEGVQGAFETGAVGVIGMLLASRDDRLPGCLNAPASIPTPWSVPAEPAYIPQPETPVNPPVWEQEPVAAPEPAPVVPVEPAPNYESETVYEPVQKPYEPEPPQPPVRKQEPERKKPAAKKPGWGRVIWTKLSKVGSNVAEGIGSAVDKFYTSVTEEVNE